MEEKKPPHIIAGVGVPAIKGSAAFFIVFIVAFAGAVLLMKNKKQISRQVSKNIFASEITGMTARICQVSGCFLKGTGNYYCGDCHFPFCRSQINGE